MAFDGKKNSHCSRHQSVSLFWLCDSYHIVDANSFFSLDDKWTGTGFQ